MTEIPFKDRVYHITAQIPSGRVATYGQLALMAGKPRAARAVGDILRRNPYGKGLPCHRVVNRKGELAPAGVFNSGYQRRLLQEEGVLFDSAGLIRMDLCQWDGSDYQPPREAPDYF